MIRALCTKGYQKVHSYKFLQNITFHGLLDTCSHSVQKAVENVRQTGVISSLFQSVVWVYHYLSRRSALTPV